MARFLRSERIAVAGVSRDARRPPNAIYRKLRSAGHDAVPINPHASTLEGAPCDPDVASITGHVQGVIVATHPEVALDLVRQSANRGVAHVWFHRSVGTGSVSPAAVREAEALGLNYIVGGCPLMYCEPVDPFHRCMCAILRSRGHVSR